MNEQTGVLQTQEMYAEFLERDYVLEQLSKVRDRLEQHQAESPDTPLRAPGPDGSTHELSAEDVAEALEGVRDALANETAAEGRAMPGLLGATRAFFPRDAWISNLQSRLEQCAHERFGPPPRVSATPALRAAADLDAVTSLHLPAPAAGERTAAGPFEPCDPGWLSIGAAVAKRFVTGKEPFNEDVAAADELGERARILLLSDWGTGLRRALWVSHVAQSHLHDSDAKDRDLHVIHLGDVYYAGWKHEYQQRVLDGPWPVFPGEAKLISSWALMGNHDMYSGGHDFFATLLADPRFSRQRGAQNGKPTSLLRLSNSDWRILGLDTAWDDHDLSDDQVEWIEGELIAAERKQPPQLVVLLSHHQLFSAYDSHLPTNLGDKLAPILEKHRVEAWFWGHEHRLTLYKRNHGGIGYASCIGNGGVPEYTSDRPGVPADVVRFDYESEFVQGNERWRKFACALLDINGRSMTVRYLDEDGHDIRGEPDRIPG